MSLPLQAIDRLFDRLAATYGSAWIRQWEGLNAGDVKTMWGTELAGYASHLEAIAWAFDNLPERCPNLIEFRNLCRLAPAPEVPKLPEPKADPARVAAEFAKLAPLRIEGSARVDHKAWARRILDDLEAGVHRNLTAVSMAREALRS